MTTSITICIARQVLTVHDCDLRVESFPVSTSSYGIGQEINSYKTPLGMHKVKQVIGCDQPIFTRFKARKAIEWFDECPSSDEDLILSRIIQLDGIVEGFNKGLSKDGICVDSHDRYIYIHGTNAEDSIGLPSSIGCIRMRNRDIIKLCDLINNDTLVDIVNNEVAND
ncbi:MAG: L,D-transpeptidase family protein [Candidatus Comchoanobacterales bacterium]